MKVAASSDSEIRGLLRSNLSDMIGSQAPLEDDTDFFSLGLDSLQALRLRTILLKNLPIMGSALGMNVVFDFPTINALTQELLLLQNGIVSQEMPIEEQMQAMAEKYGTFPAHVPFQNAKDGQYLVSLD